MSNHPTYSETTRKHFYQSLGKLFYAVAIADKVIRPAEVQKIKEKIDEVWIDLDDMHDEYETDMAFQMEIVFDWLQENEPEGQECFDEFVTFYEEHLALFTPKVKSMILSTANAIAGSFAGKNKAELIILAKLNILFRE